MGKIVELNIETATIFMKSNYTSSYRDLIKIAIFYITKKESHSTAFISQIKFLTDLTGIKLSLDDIRNYLIDLDKRGLLHKYKEGFRLTVRGEDKLQIKEHKQENLKYYINKLSGNVILRLNGSFKTYSSDVKKSRELLTGSIKDTISYNELTFAITNDLLNCSNSNVKMNTSLVIFHQLNRDFYNDTEKEQLLDKIKTIIETDIDIKVRAKVARLFIDKLISREEVIELLKEALKETSDKHWRYELALLLAYEEKSLEKLGSRYLKAYEDQYGLTESQNYEINQFRIYLESTKPVQEEVETLKEIIRKQPEGKEKEQLKEAALSIERKMALLLNRALDQMVTGEKQIDLEQIERIANIGRYEKWWQRNLVPLVGSILTFLAAVASIIVSVLV